jgi:multimeric flavodoxin WrbA
MKLMAFVGSPRKGSNTDILIDQVIAGVKSKREVETEKIYIYEANIQYCTGCMAHTVLGGSKECPLKDDMKGILKRMKESDAFIFGTPNHGRTISAGLTNFLCRLFPVNHWNITYDDEGTALSATVTSDLEGKKVISVISQGDPWPSSSALVMKVLDDNLKDIKLEKVGEVFSMNNLRIGDVKNKKEDMELAFAQGERLALRV